MKTLNLKEALELTEYLFNRRKVIREKKGKDYASTENVHKNFDTMAKICELLEVDVTKPYGIALLYKLLKIQREANLLFSNKIPQNEPILDTLLDEANYNDLEIEILVREGIITIDQQS